MKTFPRPRQARFQHRVTIDPAELAYLRAGARRGHTSYFLVVVIPVVIAAGLLALVLLTLAMHPPQ